MYAIIMLKGKQYRVKVGEVIFTDNLNKNPKDIIEVSEVIATMDKEINVGSPFLENARVKLEVMGNFKQKKIVILKKRRRKNSKVKKGFRKNISRVRVLDIAA